MFSGYAQEVAGPIITDPRSLSLDEDSGLDGSFFVPRAIALPGEAKVNTVGSRPGPGINFTSIQEAIDNSSPGDVIYVQSGTFNEIVSLNKPGLYLRGVDSGDGNPIVSGDGIESTVTLAADGCTLEGFVVMNSGNPHAGIAVRSNNNVIANNTVMINLGFGILLSHSTNNSLLGNNVTNNGFSGIGVTNSSNNQISSNIAIFNNRSGIEILDSPHNLIRENVASNNGEHGIRLHRSDDNALKGNIISNNTREGISIEDSRGTVTEENVVIDVKKVAVPEEGGPSTEIGFYITVTNAGQVDFERVMVADRLPAGLDYVSDNRSGLLEGGEVVWTLPGTLDADESLMIYLSSSISGVAYGNLTNIIRATGVTSEGVAVSNSARVGVVALLVVGPNGSISKAIEQARDGDVLEVQSGTYREKIVLDKSITLRGVDTGGGPPVLMGDGVGSTLTILADGCTVEGFVVTESGNPHAGIEIRSNGNSISNNVIRNNRGYGVLISGALRNLVLSNEIRENGFAGVFIEGAGNNRVSDNAINLNGNFGIGLEKSSENVLSANRIASNSRQGIDLLDSGGNAVLSNVIRGSSGNGIKLASSEANEIYGNVVSDSRDDGIYLEGSSENSISSNTLQGNLIGLRLRSSQLNTISDNGAKRNREHGISLRGSRENAISGNSAEENQIHGFRLIGSDENTLGDNDALKNRGDGIYLEGCRKNVITANAASANRNGLSLRSSIENEISRNVMEDNGEDGISLSGSEKNALSSNVVRENSGRGISLSASRENEISGNTVATNRGNGVNLAGSNKNRITGSNLIEGNVIGLYLSTSSDNVVIGGTIRDNTLRGIHLSGSSRNSIYLNEFANLQNARSEGGSNNVWSSPTVVVYRSKTTRVGNRWSDYAGWDCDGEGIGDVPYEIPGGAEEQDEYPMTDRTGTRTLTVCKSGGCNYNTIQAAIDAACPGDTIEVRSGTYNERVNLNKRLTLRGLDAGSGKPVVDAGGSGSPITISADGCMVEGFEARNSGSYLWTDAGIKVSSNDNIISDNIATDNKYYGIYLHTSDNNTLSGNTVTYNDLYGIYLFSSSYNTLSYNTVSGNKGGCGIQIHMDSSRRNTLTSNTITDDEIGIGLRFSRDNTLSGNYVNGSYYGIHLNYSSGNTISDNTAEDNSGDGIYLDSSSDNTLSGNIANVNWNGIYLLLSSNNTLSGNNAYHNLNSGIYFYSSSNNTLSGNTATDSDVCIYMDSSSGNTIYLNNFDNAGSNSNYNFWNSTVLLDYTYNGTVYTNYTGNFWSDYDGSDPDEDGIGNTPYVIGDSERDHYPMIRDSGLTMTALAPAILVDLSGDLATGSPSDAVNLTLNVTNPGPDSLTSVGVAALIPMGMSYIPGWAPVEPDSVAEGEGGTWTAAWEEVGDLGAGEYVTIRFAARIDGDLFGDLILVATATATATVPATDSGDEGDGETAGSGGTEYRGEIVPGEDSWTVFVPGNAGAEISVKKTADPQVAEPGTIVTFTIDVKNSGRVDLTNLTASDLLPAGMTYISASPAPSSDPVKNPDGTTLVNWNLTALPALLPGGSSGIELSARVDDDAGGNLTNRVTVSAKYRDGGVGYVNASDSATVELRALNVTKAADKGVVKRGENITYNITVCNVGSLSISGIVIEDVFNRRVEVVSESISRGHDGRWRIDLLKEGECFSIILVVKVPRQEFVFDMASRVLGEGFVNVADGYSTTLDPFVIRNVVYAISENTTRQYSDSASVTVLGEPGTELAAREHGSGAYRSEELVEVRTENKSISMEKDVSATFSPTTLGLYNNRTVTYSSRWTQEAGAKNRITGTSLSESYRYATSIDRKSRIFLDQNESVMEIDSEFQGVGSFGFLKKEPASSPKSTPIFESREDYKGSFRVLERFDEYGSGVGSERSASGRGLVAVDRRVGSGQRSYESGAGSYRSEELIRTETNYIAKDLSVESGTVSVSLSPGLSINTSMKWKEGMVSRVVNASLIGEEYSGASRLDKETVARGLNEMETLAGFTGKGRYRVVLKDEIDFDEEYEGSYSVERRVLLKGVPRYERPHLSLRKEGEIVYLHPEMERMPLVRYSIIIENDGDRSLGPVIVRDIFPPGAVFINSSLRPSELAEGRATWTLTHLAIGDRFEIDLFLNLTAYPGYDIVNQVEAEGGYNGDWARAENFSAIGIDWLRYSPSEDIIRVSKTGLPEGEMPQSVLYTIEVENVGEGTAAAVVTDYLPHGMLLLEASPNVASLDKGVATWNLVDLKSGEKRTINYRVEVQLSGRFVNQVRVDSTLVEGSMMGTAYASSVVLVRDFEAEIPAPGWQPPDWGLTGNPCQSETQGGDICKFL